METGRWEKIIPAQKEERRDIDEKNVERRDKLIKSHSFTNCVLFNSKMFLSRVHRIALHHRSHRLFFTLRITIKDLKYLDV